MSDKKLPLHEAMRSASKSKGAQYWLEFGYSVIPVGPGTKATAVKWDPWLADPSPAQIRNHWRAHPDHEVGFIVGDAYIVFDADTAKAVTALKDAEKRMGISAGLVVRTKRGEHHHFRREAGSTVRCSIGRQADSAQRIDILTGRHLVILPPSTGKVIVDMGQGIWHANDLTVAPQAFVDDMLLVSGHGPIPVGPPRPPRPAPPTGTSAQALRLVSACLKRLDPDMGYEDWFRVVAAIFNYTAASEDGYELFDAWSSKGRKYKGRGDTRTPWGNLSLDHPSPITIATLRQMLQAAGHDWAEVCCDAEGDFEIIEGEGA